MAHPNSQGIIKHPKSDRSTDYLYRISIKSLVVNSTGEVLVVKEAGREWWDLPGGGMDHGENLAAAIAREMREEVNLVGDFSYRIISVDEPAYLETHSFWQVRLVFRLSPVNMVFSAGEDADEIKFLNPETFKDSLSEVKRRIYTYAKL